MYSTLRAACLVGLFGLTSVAAQAASDDTRISGKMYFNFSQIDQTGGDAGDVDVSGHGLDVKRFYLGVGHDLDDTWSLHLTTDFNYVSHDGETNLFVKKAYVQGRFSDAAVLRVGSAGTPWIGLVEDYYGYRYVEKSLIDRVGFGSSADWGVHLGGELGGTGRFNYAVSVVNGAGYKHAERSKGTDVAARIGYQPVPGLILALGGYRGKRGQETEQHDALHTAKRTDLMLAWARDGFRLGAEYFRADNWNQVLSPRSDKASGWSAWSSLEVGPATALFVRYDRVDPHQKTLSGEREVYYNAGAQYQVTKGFKLAAVYKHREQDRGVPGPLLPPAGGAIRTHEVGLWGEVRF